VCSGTEMPDMHYFATLAFSIEVVQRDRITIDTFNCPSSPELRCRWNAYKEVDVSLQKVPYAQQLSLLGLSSLNISTIRRHLNSDVAVTHKEVGVFRGRNTRSALHCYLGFL